MFRKLFKHFLDKLAYNIINYKLERKMKKYDRIMRESPIGSEAWDNASDEWFDALMDWSLLNKSSNLIYTTYFPPKKQM